MELYFCHVKQGMDPYSILIPIVINICRDNCDVSHFVFLYISNIFYIHFTASNSHSPQSPESIRWVGAENRPLQWGGDYMHTVPYKHTDGNPSTLSVVQVVLSAEWVTLTGASGHMGGAVGGSRVASTPQMGWRSGRVGVSMGATLSPPSMWGMVPVRGPYGGIQFLGWEEGVGFGDGSWGNKIDCVGDWIYRLDLYSMLYKYHNGYT